MTIPGEPTTPQPELTPSDYEELTRQIVDALASIEGVQTIRIEHDVVLPGRVHDHQIDVVWDYERNGGRERVVFECRRFKQNLKNTHVWAFKGIVDDLAEPAKGVMVTQTGFQKAPLQVGEAHRIDLWTLRKPKEADWVGRLRDVEIRGVPTEPVVADLDLDVDTTKTSGVGRTADGNQDSFFVQPDGVVVRLGDVIEEWLESVGVVESPADLVAVRSDFPGRDGSRCARWHRGAGEEYVRSRRSRPEGGGRHRGRRSGG